MTLNEAIQLAIQHHTAGRLAEAEQIYRQVLQQDPNHSDALHLLGVIAIQAGRSDMAIDLINRAIKGRSDSPLFFSNLAEAYRKMGRLDEGENAARRAIEIAPNLSLGHANLGAVLCDLEKWPEAEKTLRRALEIEATMPISLTSLGNAIMHQGRLDEAIEIARRAVEMAPDLAIAHNNLGAAVDKNDMIVEAEACYRTAISLNPRQPEFLVNLGNVLYQRGDLPNAMKAWEQALVVKPDHADAHFNIGLGAIAGGDYARGWPEHEWRFKATDSSQYYREYPVPRWTGFDLKGKTILLYPEQGYGDVIQFGRFLPELTKLGARTIIHLPPELTELFKGIDGIWRVVGPDEELPPFDTHQALLSVPWILRTTLQTLPANIPYIKPDPRRTAAWREWLSEYAGKPRVGIVWAGRPTHTNDVRRSMPLRMLAPLSDVNVTLFSLQKGNAAAQLADPANGVKAIDLGKDFNDFADTAAAIANLDLVITVDTVVAHLAGAIGIPVWMMLPFAPDYRWMLEREDSPWYPTMRLFRQKRRNEWEDVVARVRDALNSGSFRTSQ